MKIIEEIIGQTTFSSENGHVPANAHQTQIVAYQIYFYNFCGKPFAAHMHNPKH